MTNEVNQPSTTHKPLFDRLRSLKNRCEESCNKHDQVDALIEACIADEAIDTLPQITGVLTKLGYKRGHIVRRLDEGVGHRWVFDADGRYTMQSS